MVTLAIVVLAYFLGSISFAVLVSKAFALPDPHTYGSKNPGATNVLRSGNKAAAILTLLGDALKGFVAVYLGRRLGAQWGDESICAASAALAVIVGHLYPIYHRFKGGKGVATAAGVLCGLDWRVGGGACGVWLIAFALSRISAVGAMSCAVAAPILGFWLMGNRPESWVLVPIATLIIWRHRANLQRLLSGGEESIGDR